MFATCSDTCFLTLGNTCFYMQESSFPAGNRIQSKTVVKTNPAITMLSILSLAMLCFLHIGNMNPEIQSTLVSTAPWLFIGMYVSGFYFLSKKGLYEEVDN